MHDCLLWNTHHSKQVTEFKSKMETWGLLRLAFSAARVALSKSGIAQISVRSFNGVSAGDPLCARHSLALAALVARDPQVRLRGLYRILSSILCLVSMFMMLPSVHSNYSC